MVSQLLRGMDHCDRRHQLWMTDSSKFDRHLSAGQLLQRLRWRMKGAAGSAASSVIPIIASRRPRLRDRYPQCRMHSCPAVATAAPKFWGWLTGRYVKRTLCVSIIECKLWKQNSQRSSWAEHTIGGLGPKPANGLKGQGRSSGLGEGTIRYDTRCYFNVRSKADTSQLNLPHGTKN